MEDEKMFDVVIEEGSILPKDLLSRRGGINREKYIVQVCFPEKDGSIIDDKCMSEYVGSISPEVIGAIIIGSGAAYQKIRVKSRTKEDPSWDSARTMGRCMFEGRPFVG